MSTKRFLVRVEPQPDYIESSGRWRWPLPCINWPCAKGAGHAGPCGTSRDELSSKQDATEIYYAEMESAKARSSE